MARRQVIDIAGMRKHSNPIPSAVRIGNMIYSSVIGGHAFGSQELPDDPAAQIANAFANMRRIVEAGGGTVDEIAIVDVLLRTLAHRALVNEQWLAMFPDENDRPARHSCEADLPPGVLIHLKVVAVVS